MSLSAENLPSSTAGSRQRVGPFLTGQQWAPVSLDNYAPAPADGNWWDGSISEAPQKSRETSDSEKSRETTEDEAARTKKVLRGGLKESKWAVAGLDPVKARRARGLPGTYKEEQKNNILSLLNEEKADRRRNNQTAGEASPEVGGRKKVIAIIDSESSTQTDPAARPRKNKAIPLAEFLRS